MSNTSTKFIHFSNADYALCSSLFFIPLDGFHRVLFNTSAANIYIPKQDIKSFATISHLKEFRTPFDGFRIIQRNTSAANIHICKGIFIHKCRYGHYISLLCDFCKPLNGFRIIPFTTVGIHKPKGTLSLCVSLLGSF